jgi:hypothetical protein
MDGLGVMGANEVTMSDQVGAMFARSVVSWFAGELDRAVLEVECRLASGASTAATAHADLREAQQAVMAIERIFLRLGDEREIDGEVLAGRFCVQLVWGFCALFEWHRLEIEGVGC